MVSRQVDSRGCFQRAAEGVLGLAGMVLDDGEGFSLIAGCPPEVTGIHEEQQPEEAS